ncbi:hypothetical protein IX51_00325 [uncultured archaeon]|nr:hypothetical protein IX51_00325 [uncultured archaeon]HKJ96805.1 indolepyruvate oxidoreductase subunit beta [Thermoplasmataceae archaeon]
MEVNVIVAGVGGQGVVTAGTLISQSALVKGHNVVMSEIHGLAQRGGSVSVEVRIGNIRSPIIPKGETDLILGIEPIEAVRAAENAGERTDVLINIGPVEPVSLSMRGKEYPDMRELVSEIVDRLDVHFIDALPLALEAGDARAVSTVMVGAALQLGILPIDEESTLEALKKRFSERLYTINEKALKLGMKNVLLALHEI